MWHVNVQVFQTATDTTRISFASISEAPINGNTVADYGEYAVFQGGGPLVYLRNAGEIGDPGQWTGPSSSTPEPATLIPLSLAGLCLLLVRCARLRAA
jgi:hypothetical protein